MEELNNTNQNWYWFKVDNALIDDYACKIGHTATAIYLCIKRYEDNIFHEAYPSYEWIADKLGISTRTVARNISTLERYGLIIREKKKYRGQWANYTYILTSRDKWIYEPYDKKSHGRMTKRTLPDDKSDKHQETQSHIKNTNTKKTYSKKTKEKKILANKLVDGLMGVITHGSYIDISEDDIPF